MLPSFNGSNVAYLAGLQNGWAYFTSCDPINGNNPSSTGNENAFLSEIAPSWTGTPKIASANINFWKTYFTQNGTG